MDELKGKILIGYCFEWNYFHSSYGQTSSRLAKTEVKYIEVDPTKPLFESILEKNVDVWKNFNRNTEPNSGPPETYHVVVCGSRIDCGFFRLDVSIPSVKMECRVPRK